MTTVSFKFAGDERLNDLLEFLRPGAIEKAQRAGMKYAASPGRTTAAKGVTSRYALPSARIKQDIEDPRVLRDGETIEYRFKTDPPTLRAYGWRQTRSGVSGQVIRGRRHSIRSGFIPTGGRVAGLVVRRLTEERYPIQVLKGASVGRIIMGSRSTYGETIRQEILDRVNEAYFKGVERHLRGVARRGQGI